LTVGNIFTALRGELSAEVRKKLSDELSYLLPSSEFAVRGWEIKKRKELIQKYGEAGRTMPFPYVWDGRYRFLEGRYARFPSGLYRRALKVLSENGVESITKDARIQPLSTLDLKLHGFIPYDFQNEAVKATLAKTRGLIRIGTGGGKTNVIAMILAGINVRSLILIHRETIYRQLIDRLGKSLGTKIGSIGSGKANPAPITVAMMQTMTQERYKFLLKEYQAVIIDECHHTPSNSMYTILKNCSSAYYRFGLTATHKRDDGADMFMEAALGGLLYDLGPSELIRKGRLTKPKIFFIKIPIIPRWDLLGYPNQYSKCVVEGKFRNEVVLDAAKLFYDLGKTCLVAVTQIRHGEALIKDFREKYPQIRTAFVKGEIDSDEKQSILRRLNDKKLDVVFATSVFGEGVDVPSLGGIINAKAQDSQVDTIQLAGRALRKSEGKDYSLIIDFEDSQSYLKKHAEKRKFLYEQEQEFDVTTVNNIIELNKFLL
jgi:superfamily II DNA or RNA helicase